MTPTATAVKTHTVIQSPVGPLTLVAAGEDLCGVYFDDQRHAPLAGDFGDFTPAAEAGPLAAAATQLEAYFAGRLTTFDLPLAASGTPFQLRVWAALAEIPYGETRTYGDIALRLGQPGAARAVGLANGRNPIGIIVPCHRVIGADGSLTGYGGGMARKRALLDLEQQAGLLD